MGFEQNTYVVHCPGRLLAVPRFNVWRCESRKLQCDSKNRVRGSCLALFKASHFSAVRPVALVRYGVTNDANCVRP